MEKREEFPIMSIGDFLRDCLPLGKSMSQFCNPLLKSLEAVIFHIQDVFRNIYVNYNIMFIEK